jgi:molybdenum cofactor cytidylyltransferase
MVENINYELQDRIDMLDAVVLAAGTSSRMHQENKLTMTMGACLIIEKVIAELSKSKIGKIIVVLGHEHQKVKEVLSKYDQVNFVYNSIYEKGQLSSIQAGMSEVRPESQGFMVCLGDMPMITTDNYNFLIDQFADITNEIAKPIIRPIFKGSPGHPVIFHQSYKNVILSTHFSKDCKDIIKSNIRNFKGINVNTINYFFDVDNHIDYDRLIRYVEGEEKIVE